MSTLDELDALEMARDGVTPTVLEASVGEGAESVDWLAERSGYARTRLKLLARRWGITWPQELGK